MIAHLANSLVGVVAARPLRRLLCSYMLVIPRKATSINYPSASGVGTLRSTTYHEGCDQTVTALCGRPVSCVCPRRLLARIRCSRIFWTPILHLVSLHCSGLRGSPDPSSRGHRRCPCFGYLAPPSGSRSLHPSTASACLSIIPIQSGEPSCCSSRMRLAPSDHAHPCPSQPARLPERTSSIYLFKGSLRCVAFPPQSNFPR